MRQIPAVSTNIKPQQGSCSSRHKQKNAVTSHFMLLRNACHVLIEAQRNNMGYNNPGITPVEGSPRKEAGIVLPLHDLR